MANTSISLAMRYAMRDMRHGLKGFKIFIICLLLGVFIIACVGLLTSMIDDALKRNAKSLLGGDYELYMTYRGMDELQREFMESQGTLSLAIELRTIAKHNDTFQLVELKSVDEAYPLYGEVKLDPPMPLQQALQGNGIVVEPDLLERFAIKVGETLAFSGEEYLINAVILAEPDRVVNTFSFGPRALMSESSLRDSSLLQPGGLTRYRYRIALNNSIPSEGWKKKVEDVFPDADWRIRDFSSAAPQVERILNNLSLFLTLTGLTALIAGSVGISNSVNALVQRKYFTIATLKSIGASSAFVFWYYLLLIMAVALGTIAIALSLALLAAWQGAGLINQLIDLGVRFSFDFTALSIATLYGLLITLTFSLWQLGKVYDIKPSSIFKGRAGIDGKPPKFIRLFSGLLLVVLVLFAVVTSSNRAASMMYIVSLFVTIFLYYYASACLVRVTSRRRNGRFWLRHGLANLSRPGARTLPSIVSLGIGLTFLVCISLIDGNIQRSIQNIRPDDAPTHFFIDIQSDQQKGFRALLEDEQADDIQLAPMIRGNITHIKGVPAAEVDVASDVRWAVRGDRGFSYAATPPKGTEMIAGEWWANDYSGKPLISFDERIARGMGVGIGDELSFSVLGEPIVATIHSLRKVDYQNFRMNFAIIFSPGVLEDYPQTHIATANVPPTNQVLKRLAETMPNISPINVEHAVRQVAKLTNDLALAIRITAIFTLVSAVIVLIGTLVAAEEQRVRDIIVLKVLGARKMDIIKSYLVEYSCIGLIAGGVAVVAGSAISYIVIEQFRYFEFGLLPHVSSLIVLASLLVIIVIGLAITLRSFKRKPLEYLRND